VRAVVYTPLPRQRGISGGDAGLYSDLTFPWEIAMKAMHPVRASLAAALAVVLASAAVGALAQSGLKKADGVLVDAAGMTVYTFDKDTVGSGKSACNEGCAKMWPPVPADSGEVAAPYSLVARHDGTKQLAYKGKPLYLFAKDTKPGERKGDKMKDVWHVVTD
jgi:predicted lipoprotein with Yx(FWY)xxD motif